MRNSGQVPAFRTPSKTFSARLLLCAIMILLAVPAWADDKAKDEDTLVKATQVLKDMVSGDKVPADILAEADCVIVMPSVKKFGFGIGGSGGRGPMICRKGKSFSGAWSAPAMYTIGGASVGLQVGGSSTDYVLLVMSDKGVNAVLEGKTKLGNEATAAAGPSGATHTGTIGGTDILTYARASGLFAGTSLGGATLAPDSDANRRLYNKPVSAKEIVIQNAVQPTPAGESLASLLNAKVPDHKKQ
jgi:SH3 domain-containing YSC84-like protein 1